MIQSANKKVLHKLISGKSITQIDIWEKYYTNWYLGKVLHKLISGKSITQIDIWEKISIKKENTIWK